MNGKNNNENNYKILIVYKGPDGSIDTESVWAEKRGDNYKILNVPFFAPNIAYGDIVQVENDNGTLYFDELIEESGHSTIQIIIFDKENQSQIENEIVGLGCDWEGSHIKNYISVDVPPTISYNVLKAYLSKAQSLKKLDYKEACLSQIHRY